MHMCNAMLAVFKQLMMAELKAKFFCEVCDREFQYLSKYRIHLASINHRAIKYIIKAGSQSPDVTYTGSRTEPGDFSGTEVEGACTDLGSIHSAN